MDCLTVRDRLAEHALGTLSGREARAVDRHLAWCAACRKEARELQDAAAVVAFALEPAPPPPPALEERVVRSVRRAAGRPAGRRRGRAVLAWALAAAVGLAGLGWGAVMAGRAERFERAALEAERRQDLIARRLAALLETAPFAGRDDARVVQLTPAPSAPVAGGAVVVLASPRRLDLAVALLAGLDPADREGFPYRVWLLGPRGRELLVARIGAHEVGRDGSAEEARELPEDLSTFTDVVVRDARGVAVLRGTVPTAEDEATG